MYFDQISSKWVLNLSNPDSPQFYVTGDQVGNGGLDPSTLQGDMNLLNIIGGSLNLLSLKGFLKLLIIAGEISIDVLKQVINGYLETPVAGVNLVGDPNNLNRVISAHAG